MTNAGGPVDAARYDAFWLWAGVKAQPVLTRAKTLYILQAQVTAREPVRLQAQRAAIPQVRGPNVWMVVRVETLRWPGAVYDQVLKRLQDWRDAGNRLVGLQIDFDARTRRLNEYVGFLTDLRRRLPRSYALSVTGLLDWSSHGDSQSLNLLARVVDEVVLQIYQGRRVIPGYATYLEHLDRLHVPFRIGLLQGGEWTPPKRLEANPWFRGCVVFLVNR